MGRKWNQDEIQDHFTILYDLYVTKNKSIKEIAFELSVSEKTVFKRLKVLGIKTTPHLKEGYRNQRTVFVIPNKKSQNLAEFFGIMLGDGSLSRNQIAVTLGNKEKDYVLKVQSKMQDLFKTHVCIAMRAGGYHDVYISSVKISEWLLSQGLVYHKTKSQVSVPGWIFSKKVYQKGFLRGFFDTDGSVYRISHGIQISFTNKSEPLLESLQKMLITLKYSVSQKSCSKIYLTKKEDICRFFREIKPENKKHKERFVMFQK